MGDRPAPDAGWGGILPFFGSNVLFGAGLFAHAFLYNFYLEALGLGEGVMGLAAASLTAGGLAALAPAGVALDRWGARATYVLAAVVAGLGLAWGAVVETPVPIYVAAFVAGAGTAAWRVCMGPVVMSVAHGKIRSRVFSWNVALLVGSGAAWTVAAGGLPAWLERAMTWDELSALRAALVLGAAGTALAGALFFRVPLGPRRPANPKRVRPGSAALVRSLAVPRRVQVLVALILVWMVGGGLVIPFFNLYFLRVHEMPVERIGVLFAGVQILTAIVLFAGGEVAQRLGPHRAFAAWAALYPPALWALAATAPLGLAAGLYALQGLVPPATNPLLDQILLEEAPEERHGAVSSWRNGATELSGMVGSSVGGAVLKAASFGLLFGVAGAVALVGAGGLFVAFRRTSR